MAVTAMLVLNEAAASGGANGGLSSSEDFAKEGPGPGPFLAPIPGTSVPQLTGWSDLCPPSAHGPGATPSHGLGSLGEADTPSGQLWGPSPPEGESQNGTSGDGMIIPLPPSTLLGGGVGEGGTDHPTTGGTGDNPGVEMLLPNQELGTLEYSASC